MTDNNKIYDDKISPLMSEIIRICQEHNIPMVASFFIGDDARPDFVCTTALIGGNYKNTPPQYFNFVRAIALNEAH